MGEHQHILLTSAGRRVELYQALQQSLSARVQSGRVYCADLNPHLSSACIAAQSPYSLPRVTSDAYPAALLALCQSLGIGMVVPTIDTELLVLARLKRRFCEHGIALIVSDEELVRLCRDKRETPHLYDRIGLESLKILDPDQLSYPCFTKPAGGSSSIGALQLDHAGQLDEAMRAESDRMYMELAAPEWVEFTIDLYCDREGMVQSIVPRERIETRAGEVSKGCTRRGWIYEYLDSRLSRIDGAIGCLTLQVFADHQAERCYAIEINPRFGGGFPLSYAAGADFPGWLVDEYFLGKRPVRFDSWRTNLLMLRYDAKVLVTDHGGA